MSVEKSNIGKQNPSTLTSPEVDKGKISNRVNINHLLARVRDDEKKSNKMSLFFISMIVVLIFISVLIFSF